MNLVNYNISHIDYFCSKKWCKLLLLYSKIMFILIKIRKMFIAYMYIAYIYTYKDMALVLEMWIIKSGKWRNWQIYVYIYKSL